MGPEIPPAVVLGSAAAVAPGSAHKELRKSSRSRRKREKRYVSSENIETPRQSAALYEQAGYNVVGSPVPTDQTQDCIDPGSTEAVPLPDQAVAADACEYVDPCAAVFADYEGQGGPSSGSDDPTSTRGKTDSVSVDIIPIVAAKNRPRIWSIFSVF